MNTELKTVWMIEDSDEDADNCIHYLTVGNHFNVEMVEVRRHVKEYTDLLSLPATGAFLVDWRLNDLAKGVSYDGADVAEYIRTIRPEIPIHALTNYPGDETLEAKEHPFDSIIYKGRLYRNPGVFIDRILRGMRQYEESLNEKQKRIKSLIDIKLAQGLNKTEEQELENLRADHERNYDLHLAEQQDRNEDYLQRQEERLAQLETLSRELSAVLGQAREED